MTGNENSNGGRQPVNEGYVPNLKKTPSIVETESKKGYQPAKQTAKPIPPPKKP